MTISSPKIDKQFCIAFAERAGFDVPDPKTLHIDGDWLFHFDENYPDEMDIYQYPLADFCCEVYDTCTIEQFNDCLLYTSPSPRDGLLSRMPSSA